MDKQEISSLDKEISDKLAELIELVQRKMFLKNAVPISEIPTVITREELYGNGSA